MLLQSERNFLILGLPRSRTAWLANLFTRGDSLCHHELSNKGLDAKGIAEAMSTGAKYVGNSDCGAALKAKELLELMPNLRVVIVERDLDSVLESFSKVSGKTIEELPLDDFVNRTLKALEEIKGFALVVNFKDLDKSEVVEKIWHHCLGGVPFPKEQFEVLRSLNVQMEPQFIHGALRGGTTIPGRFSPLSEKEEEFLQLVLTAHAESAFRGNISTYAIASCAAGNGTWTNSIASGLLTLGGTHAPLEQSYEILASSDSLRVVELMFKDGLRIPGWGNSFHKGEPDPLWEKVDRWLSEHYSGIHGKIEDITQFLHAAGKHIMPNPSIYTAAAAIVLGVPANCAGFLFLQGRLLSWTQIYLKGAA
jgi:hypothetical protein